jgi:hypothetical protein
VTQADAAETQVDMIRFPAEYEVSTKERFVIPLSPMVPIQLKRSPQVLLKT